MALRRTLISMMVWFQSITTSTPHVIISPMKNTRLERTMRPLTRSRHAAKRVRSTGERGAVDRTRLRRRVIASVPTTLPLVLVLRAAALPTACRCRCRGRLGAGGRRRRRVVVLVAARGGAEGEDRD